MPGEREQQEAEASKREHRIRFGEFGVHVLISISLPHFLSASLPHSSYNSSLDLACLLADKEFRGHASTFFQSHQFIVS